jgi:hypothetical protein
MLYKTVIMKTKSHCTMFYWAWTRLSAYNQPHHANTWTQTGYTSSWGW